MSNTQNSTINRDELFQLFSQYYHLEILETELVDELNQEHSPYIAGVLHDKFKEIAGEKNAKYWQINYFLDSIEQNESTNG